GSPCAKHETMRSIWSGADISCEDCVKPVTRRTEPLSGSCFAHDRGCALIGGMRFCGSAALVSSVFLVTTTAGAAGPRAVRTTRAVVAAELTAMPAAGITKRLRAQRDVKWSHPPTAAWAHLAATGTWQDAWDRATGVTSRIGGSGIPAPGAMASPDVAAAFARAQLADHIALLAPGASPADFELVANHSDCDIRSVGFAQRRDGRI